MNLTDPCFVFGLALDGNGGCVDLDTRDSHPVWLHIDYSHETSETWLAELGLIQPVIDALIRPDTRPRTVNYKSGELMVVRGINLNAGSDPEDMVSLRMWIEPNRLITVRQRKLVSVQDVKSELEQNLGPSSVSELVIRIVENMGDRVAAFIESIEDQIDQLEADVDKNKSSTTRDNISAVRRRIAVVRRYMAPQREALESLYRVMMNLWSDTQTYAVREQADRIIRYVEDLDLNRERALVLQEELINLIMEQQNSRMYALSIVAVVFLPITFVSGLFGMNLDGMPGLADPNAFSYAVITMVVISVSVLLYLAFKRWL